MLSDLKEKKIKKPVILISGGESTVNIKGTGKGGRNQEFALHLAKQIKKLNLSLKYTLLSAGTDGRDGPTNAAGAILNQNSINLIERKGINLNKELNNNNSYEVLQKINSLVIIEGTNTNVADIQATSFDLKMHILKDNKIILKKSFDFPCSYINGKTERRLYIDLNKSNNKDLLVSELTLNGFRRNHDHMYVPICQNCTMCISSRINILNFRLFKK